MRPLGAVFRGAVAGALGTLAMDILWFARFRRRGGTASFAEWELSSGLRGWDEAPAPARVGKRLFEAFFQRELPPERAPLASDVTHWGFGLFGGVQYGIVVGSLRTQRIIYGLPFGAGVWASGYAVLPAAGVYKPIWEYDRKTLADDLSAHLVYGLATALAFRLLSKTPRLAR
jgi:hypothetical protein